MPVTFATDSSPIGVLSSGNTTLILAFIIVVMAGVIVWQSRKIDQKEAKNETLQDARLDDFKTREDKVNSALELVGRNTQYMYDKMIDGKK